MLKNISKNRIFLQRLVVTSLATMVSWSLGQSIANRSGIVAAIATIITLRISLQASLSEAFTQLIGTIIGVGLAFLTLSWLGPGALAVGLTIAGSLIVVKILDLGDEGLINIAVTAIIVLAPGMPEQAASQRFLGTAIGTFTAIFFSFFNHPDTPVDRVSALLNKSSLKLSMLLSEMSEGLTNRYSVTNSKIWLERARRYATDVEYIRPYAEELLRYSKWSPRLTTEAANHNYNKFLALEHTAIQVRTIARSLYDSRVKEIKFSNLVLAELRKAILSASKQVSEWQIEDGLSLNLTTESREILKKILEVSQEEFAGEVNEDQILVLASILTNIERISESLTLETEAISSVKTPIVTKTSAEQINSRLRSFISALLSFILKSVKRLKSRSFFAKRG